MALIGYRLISWMYFSLPIMVLLCGHQWSRLVWPAYIFFINEIMY